MYGDMDEGGSGKGGEAIGLEIYCRAKASNGANVGDGKKKRKEKKPRICNLMDTGIIF